MSQINYGIIGGSGFYRPDLLSKVREVKVETPYGEIKPFIGRIGELEVAFLPRHGQDHSVLPHQINFRANLWGLQSLGVKRIVATTAVGSLTPELAPGAVVIVDQFLDFTKQRPLTFWEQGDVQKAHIDMTDPYCRSMRMALSEAAAKLTIPAQIGGCYVCFEGPRYETAAEIKMYRMLGGTVIGMTGIPETVLARELGICYANLSIITNYAAGITVAPLSHAEVVQVMALNQGKLREIIMKYIIDADHQFHCGCKK